VVVLNFKRSTLSCFNVGDSDVYAFIDASEHPTRLSETHRLAESEAERAPRLHL
jgi:serine/threonine protein phosphatase PrpC